MQMTPLQLRSCRPYVRWWNRLTTIGPAFGYFANVTKTWLITKEQHLSAAQACFAGTSVNIIHEGRPHLGAAIGTQEYAESYIHYKIEQRATEMKSLASIYPTPCCLLSLYNTHGLTSRWTCLARTMPHISALLQPLENIIRTDVLHALTGKAPPGDLKRDLLALPARLGGIALLNPTKASELEFSSSLLALEPLRDLILSQDPTYSSEVWDKQTSIKNAIHKQNLLAEKSKVSALLPRLDDTLRRAVKLASEKGASNWLTSLPLSLFGFSLHKGAFRDSLTLRYGWLPSDTPSHCDCGSKFSIEHCLSCCKGGFPSLRHNEIRNITARLLTKVCHDVCVEPNLQTITGEVFSRATSNIQEGARLDVATNGFWGGIYERTFLDVRVFNLHAHSYSSIPLSTCYHKHENTKKHSCEQCIREVEHASLIFSASGGMTKEATTFYKRLASCLAEKRDQPYSCTMNWLRCLSFYLLRSAIQCIRGARSSKGWAIGPQIPCDVINRKAVVTNSL